MKPNDTFRFKRFVLNQSGAGLKVNTDGVLLGALADSDIVGSILDIGTGTGLIALMLAQRFSSATITAIEPDLTSYALAKKNFRHSPWPGRIKLFRVTLQNFNPKNRFDLIVSNPPFSGKAQGQARNRARNPVFLPVEDIFRYADVFLNPSGSLWLIWPSDKKNVLLDAAYRYELFPSVQIDVRDNSQATVRRQIWCFVPDHKRSFRHECLVMFDREGNFTKEFASLVENFYI